MQINFPSTITTQLVDRGAKDVSIGYGSAVNFAALTALRTYTVPAARLCLLSSVFGSQTIMVATTGGTEQRLSFEIQAVDATPKPLYLDSVLRNGAYNNQSIVNISCYRLLKPGDVVKLWGSGSFTGGSVQVTALASMLEFDS